MSRQLIKTDILVIGAGPAGIATAIRAKQLRPEWQVLVLDKADFPRDKVCGDGLGPHAAAELAFLGASSILVSKSPITRVSLRGPLGSLAEGTPARPGYAIRRFELDAALVRIAREIGVEVLHERVHSAEADASSVRVNDRYEAPFVVAADGANSRIRHNLGLKGASDSHIAIAVRGYMPSPIETLTLRWESKYHPSYSWVFPMGDGWANVGYGHRKDAPGAKAALWEAVARTTGIDQGDPSLRAHHLPLSSAKLERSVGRVLFVGDAAGLINPISGEGIYYALASGRLAASALCKAENPPKDYETALSHEFRSHFRSTALLHRAQQYPRNLEAGVIAASRSSAQFDALVDIALGNGSLHAGSLPAITRAWLVK